MNFPVKSQPLDFEIVVQFLRSYSVEISSDSVNSFAIFADHVGARTDLLFSAREILARQEWKIILSGERSSQELKEIHSDRLKQWIAQRLSSEASQPWIDAISEVVGGSATSRILQQEMSSLISVENISPRRFSSIAVITALITAGLLVALKQCQSQDGYETAPSAEMLPRSSDQSKSKINAPKNNAQNSSQPLQPRSIEGERGPENLSPQRASETIAAKIYPAGEGKRSGPPRDVNPTPISMNNSERPGETIDRRPSPSNLAKTTRALNRSDLLQLVEEGSIDPNRLVLSSASGFATHWVQQMTGTSGTYLLKLRTNSQLSKPVCEGLVREYQSSYKISGRPLSVVVESNRYRRAGLTQGYLPVCKSVGSGMVEYIKYR